MIGMLHVAHLCRELAAGQQHIALLHRSDSVLGLLHAVSAPATIRCARGVEHCGTGVAGACQHLQCFRSSLEVCCPVVKQACHLFVDLSNKGALNLSSLYELSMHCITGPCLTLEPSKSGVADRCSTTTCLSA